MSRGEVSRDNLVQVIAWFGLALQSKRVILSFLEDATMPDSVNKVIELIGTSPESWEKAAPTLRVAEVAELDLVIENGEVAAYRAKVNVSCKYEGKDLRPLPEQDEPSFPEGILWRGWSD